jgi:hypothetical protein
VAFSHAKKAFLYMSHASIVFSLGLVSIQS